MRRRLAALTLPLVALTGCGQTVWDYEAEPLDDRNECFRVYMEDENEVADNRYLRDPYCAPGAPTPDEFDPEDIETDDE